MSSESILFSSFVVRNGGLGKNMAGWLEKQRKQKQEESELTGSPNLQTLCVQNDGESEVLSLC